MEETMKTMLFRGSVVSALLLMLAFTVVMAGCVYPDSDQWEPPVQPSSEEKEETAVSTAISRGTVKNEESAILAIYRYLLDQAQSHRAKLYLADFYTTCTEWSAEAELCKDGTSIWHVTVDMTAEEEWQERPYWQQAGWMILKDGTVLPSNKFQANALRIEADLHELNEAEPPEPQ
jgi:hypothetical protein